MSGPSSALPHQDFSQKRLGRTDTHTLYDAEFYAVEKLSVKDLMLLRNDKTLSKSIKDKIEETLCKKLDPQDRNAVEM